jgi:hypothetical protein
MTPKRTRIFLVTTPSNPCGDGRGWLVHRPQMQYQILGRRRARRLCKRFARVGVETLPERLQQMLAGVPFADDEMADVRFALIATQIDREARSAKFKRLQRRGTLSLMFAGLILVVLNFLFCLAYVLLNLAQQTAPL